MKLNIKNKAYDELMILLNIEIDAFISLNKQFCVFLTNDKSDKYAKYENMLIYKNVSNFNLSDFDYCVIIQID